MTRELEGVRVALDARYLGRPGMGIHAYLVAVVDVLRDHGARPVLLCDQTTRLDPRYDDLEQVVLWSPSRRAWEQVALAWHLWRNRDYDAYFAPGNTGVPLVCPMRGRRVVVTVHDLIPLRRPREHLATPLAYVGYLVGIASSVLRADTVLVNTVHGAGEIGRIFRRHAVVTGQPLPRMLGAQAPGREPAPATAARDAGRSSRPSPRSTSSPGGGRGRYVLYNGGADSRKNVDVLLHGFAEFRAVHADYELVVVGHGFERYQRLVLDSGIAGVRFAGYVDEAEKWELVRAAAALVYPSSIEGYGLPIVEGFLGETVVVSSGYEVLREVAGDAAVLLDRVSAPSIAEALERVASMDEAERSGWLARGADQLDRLVGCWREDLLVAAFRPVAVPSGACAPPARPATPARAPVR